MTVAERFARLPTAGKLLLILTAVLLPIGAALAWLGEIGIRQANSALLQRSDDQARLAATDAVEAECRAIARRRDVELAWESFFHLRAAPCDPRLQAALADSIAAHGIPVKHLPSGAGHDAMELVNIAPMAMLFVRCGNGGISHNPLETMTEDDAQTATSVLLHFLEHFDPASLKKV
jgi:acetylornithine deacetylase/succinyl-diaminopimelate desuccinylase-like protein